MVKGKARGGHQPPAKRTKTRLSNRTDSQRLLDLPLEILDVIVKLVVDEPATLKRNRRFFDEDLDFLRLKDDDDDDEIRDGFIENGICEDDQSMNEILRRSIFRTCSLLRQRAHQYVFYDRVWVRMAFRTDSVKNKFDELVSYHSTCDFARIHILPKKLPSFDLYVGSCTARAASDRTFRDSRRINVFPFDLKIWLAICAALQKLVWTEAFNDSSIKLLSARCDVESVHLVKLLPTHILPPLLATRNMMGMEFYGRHLRSIPQDPVAHMKQQRVHFTVTSDVEYLKDLLSHIKALQRTGDTETYNLFALHLDFRVNRIAEQHFGSRFYQDGPFLLWRRIDQESMKLRRLMCKHLVQAARIWHHLSRTKGLDWLRALSRRIQVSGEHRWDNPDHRILYGLSRKERAELHLAAALAKEIEARGILHLAPGYHGMGQNAANEDAWREMGDGIQHLSTSVNLTDSEEARQLLIEMKAQRAAIGNFDEGDEPEPYDDELNAYVELHGVAGGKFCWTGDQQTIDDLGGVGALAPLEVLYRPELELESSPRCGRACNCVMI